VIDTVGPQWGWWAWNTGLPTSKPSLGPLPYLSVMMFSLVLPFAAASMTLWLRRDSDRGGWYVARDIVIASVAVWPFMFACQLPIQLLESAGMTTYTARLVTTWTYIAAAAAITAYAFVGAYRTRRTDPGFIPAGVRGDRFALCCVVVYLVLAAVFWIAALPDYFEAVGGLTAEGSPTGSLVFGVAAYLSAIALLVGAHLGTTRRVIRCEPTPSLRPE
jgi:hypothetical protein